MLPCGSTLFLFDGWETIVSFLVINNMLVETIENCENYTKLLKTIKNCERGVAAHRYNIQLYYTRNRARY